MEEGEKDINNNDEAVYSPMVNMRKDQEVKMIEDNFEIINKQADPDYEAIHFSKNKKLGRNNDDIKLEGLEDLNIETFDRIETSSVLNFSSEKRDLVLGIIRKPEIKPLSVFNKELGGVLDSSTDNSLEIEVDVNMEDREDTNEDQWPSENEAGEAVDTTASLEDTESIVECPAITKNPFLKNNSKLNQHHKFKRSNIEKKQPKVVPKKFPFKRINLDHSNNKNNNTSIEDGDSDMTVTKAAALIRQFNNGSSSGKHSEGCSGDSLKTPTKKLISKFNSEKKPAFSKTNYPFTPSLGARGNNTGTKNTQTKVQQMVSAFNKSNILQNKIDE